MKTLLVALVLIAAFVAYDKIDRAYSPEEVVLSDEEKRLLLIKTMPRNLNIPNDHLYQGPLGEDYYTTKP